MKRCILKRIIWSENNYTAPCQKGLPTGSDFVKKNGYGHEEWNNTLMKYNDFIYFNTAGDSLAYEAPKRESRKSKEKAEGNICMLLFALHEKKFYIRGVAAGVKANTPKEMSFIADYLDIKSKGKEIWKLPHVKKLCSNNYENFKKDWMIEYQWQPWSCPKDLFFWFPQPVRFEYKKVLKEENVLYRFSNHRNVSQKIALNLLKTTALPKDSPILTWLENRESDAGKLHGNIDQKQESDGETSNKSGGNSSSSIAFEYYVCGKRSVYPKHKELQEAFVKHLEASNIVCEQDKNYVDITYKDKDQLVFVEIKPAESIDTKIAIWLAIGQLLEYRYTKNQNALLHIVVDKKPRDKEISFVKSLGIMISYKDKKGDFCKA